jgi:hypothetical protein
MALVTFGVWHEGSLVPLKARSGLIDEEIREVDRFVRQNTRKRFGPLRYVRPSLVLEIASENIQLSKAQFGYRRPLSSHGPVAARQVPGRCRFVGCDSTTSAARFECKPIETGLGVARGGCQPLDSNPLAALSKSFRHDYDDPNAAAKGKQIPISAVERLEMHQRHLSGQYTGGLNGQATDLRQDSFAALGNIISSDNSPNGFPRWRAAPTGDRFDHTFDEAGNTVSCGQPQPNVRQPVGRRRD